MNFSRRSFATFSRRRPQQATLALRTHRPAMPTTPSPFFRQPTMSAESPMKIGTPSQSLRAA